MYMHIYIIYTCMHYIYIYTASYIYIYIHTCNIFTCVIVWTISQCFPRATWDFNTWDRPVLWLLAVTEMVAARASLPPGASFREGIRCRAHCHRPLSAGFELIDWGISGEKRLSQLESRGFMHSAWNFGKYELVEVPVMPLRPAHMCLSDQSWKWDMNGIHWNSK